MVTGGRLAASLVLAAAVGASQAVSLSAAATDPAVHEHAEPVVLAPGYADLEFVPPAPGSYRLPPLGSAPDGLLLDSTGERVRLHDVFAGRFVILSFIYTRCGDVNGCPLATHVLRRVHNELLAESKLANVVQLVSISFDPAYDTPEVMAGYAQAFAPPDADWRFLTSSNEAELAPLLRDYDQWVIRDYDEQGRALGTISHLLRVYLIDQQQRIRNIYSVSFLHADTIANDIATLMMESG